MWLASGGYAAAPPGGHPHAPGHDPLELDPHRKLAEPAPRKQAEQKR